MDLGLDVTDHIEKAVQHLLPVLLEVGLEETHLFHRLLLNLGGGAAVGTQGLKQTGKHKRSY